MVDSDERSRTTISKIPRGEKLVKGPCRLWVTSSNFWGNKQFETPLRRQSIESIFLMRYVARNYFAVRFRFFLKLLKPAHFSLSFFFSGKKQKNKKNEIRTVIRTTFSHLIKKRVWFFLVYKFYNLIITYQRDLKESPWLSYYSSSRGVAWASIVN